MSGDAPKQFALNPVVGSVEIPARVRVAKTETSPSQLEEARKSGTVRATPLDRAELVVGGAVVAVGRITEENGTATFTVEELR